MGNYFGNNRLNYSMGDEDSSVELSSLSTATKNIVAVAGSGGRIVPLLSAQPASLTCVDISPMQLSLTRMRLSAVNAFELGTYRRFLGYGENVMSPGERRGVFESLPLPEADSGRLRSFFEKQKWREIIYTGEFEKTLILFSKLVRLVMGPHARQLFTYDTLDAQRHYIAHDFPMGRWLALTRLLANSALLNTVLYRGDFPKKNIPGSYYSNYKRIFNSLFYNIPARNSFFLQLLCLGHVEYETGFLLEAQERVFQRAKEALAVTRVGYFQGDMLAAIHQQEDLVDFVSYSDVPTFFPEPRSNRFLDEVRHYLRPYAKLVYREHMRSVAPCTEGYRDISEDNTAAIQQEATGLWRVRTLQKL